MICSRPALVDEDKFAAYFAALEDQGEEELRISPLKVIEDSGEVKETKGLIENVLDEEFKALDGYKEELMPFVKVYEEHVAIDFDGLEGENDGVYRNLMHKIDRDQFFIGEKLEVTKVLGILSVDCAEVKKQIMKQPGDSRRMMEQTIPVHSAIIIKALMDNIKIIEDGINSAKRDPVNSWEIDEYVAYKKFLEEHRRSTDYYEDLLIKAKSMHMIMTEFRLKISSKHRKELDVVSNRWKTVKDKFKVSYESCEAAETAQKTALLKKIPEIKEKLRELLTALDNEKYYKKSKTPRAILDELMVIEQRIGDVEGLCSRAEDNAAYFQMPKDDFDERKDLREKYLHLSKYWNDQVFWKDTKKQWYNTPISKVDTEAISKKINEMKATAKSAEVAIREIFELNFDIAKEFQEKKLDPMLSTIDVINNILKETVEKRHWDTIAQKINCGYARDDAEFTFVALMDMLADTKQRLKESRVDLKIEDWIATVADQAKYEHKLSRDFERIRARWDVHLTTQQVGNRVKVQDMEGIFSTLEECMVSLDAILGNEYAAPLKDRAEQLYGNIAKIEEILSEMAMVESKMQQVDELLETEEFKTLTFSNNRYDEVQKQWKRYLRRVGSANEPGRDTLSQRFLSGDGRDLASYQELNRKMDEILAEVELKTEDKQFEYPRFYFLSSKQFISLAADPNKLNVINNYLQTIFPSAQNLITVEDVDELYPVGVVSKEGEIFTTTTRGKKVSDPADAVLKSLEETIRKELKLRIRSFYNDYMSEKKYRNELDTTSPAQVALVAESLIFANYTEVVIEEEDDYEDNMEIYYQEQCLAYAELAKVFASQTLLTEAQRLALSALIVQYVHFRDVIDFLIRNDVHSVSDFNWQIQLRYYLQGDNVLVKQLGAVLEYGFEYLGARLCTSVTPLAERCWVACTSALQNKYWTAVAGDCARTEMVEGLALSLGKHCHVHECEPNTSVRVLEKMLVGAAGSFSWVIFKNANELQYEVLSAFGHVLNELRQTLVSDKTEWMLNGQDKIVQVVPKSAIQLNNCPYFGVFFTLLHSNKREMPYVIKNLFRPIAVTQFDIGAAAEALLYSFGFKDGSSLGGKLEKFLRAVQDSLTAEVDLSTRTVIPIIRIAGELRGKEEEGASEGKIMALAIRQLFSTRLADDQLANVERVARMIFFADELPALSAPCSELTEEIIKQAMQDLSMEYDTDATRKILEFDSGVKRSPGCILVGEPACGKTSLLKLYCKCQELLKGSSGEKCDVVTLYPKSFARRTLYGFYEGKDWVKGILADNLQELVNRKKKDCYSFLHCDGPLDVSWAEQLQSALSPNSKLTLANGDCVALDSNTKVVYETETLSNASPALVSQTQIFYFPKELLVARNIINKWIVQLKDKVKAYDIVKVHLVNQINALLNSGLEERGRIPKLKESRLLLNNNAIGVTFCNIFEAVYSMCEGGMDQKWGLTDEKLKKVIGKVVVYSLAWALGGSLESGKVKKIDDFIEEGANLGDKPKEHSCFDVYLRMREGFAEFAPWTELYPPFRSEDPEAAANPDSPFAYSDTRAFTQMLVPTKELLRYKWFTEILGASGKDVLLYGSSGSGKSLLQNYSFTKEAEGEVDDTGVAKRKSNCKKLSICFTWHTTADTLQNVLESRLEKKRKNLFSAPSFKNAVVFVDDINIPKADEYGTIPALECLREMAEHRGYYDRSKYFWKQLHKTSFVCTASPESGGRKKFSNRLLRHFNVFYMNTTGFIRTRELFEVVVMAHFQDFPREYSVVKSGYLDGIMEAHELAAQKFVGSPKRPHYFLSYKDAGKVLGGVLLGKKLNIPSTEVFGRLIVHECARVYQDRLATPQEKIEFGHEMDKVIEKHLNPKWKFEEVPNLMFSSITSSDPSQYVEVENWQDVQSYLQEQQEKYNSETSHKKLNLIFFREAVEFIVRVSRILILPRSHLINIGPGELGRCSLLRIASYIHEQQMHALSYREPKFEKVIASIFQSIKETCEEINKKSSGYKGAILFCKTGESVEDLSELELKESRKFAKNTESIMDNLYQLASTGELRHIINEELDFDIRDYLHMIIQVPSEPEDLRKKTRMYPALFSECNIVYQNSWPLEAIVSIANKKIEGQVDEALRPQIAESVVRIHALAKEEAAKVWTSESRKILVAASKQWELPGTFASIYKKKTDELDTQRKLLERAIESVEQSEAVEAKYQEENAQKRAEGEKRKKETDEAYAKCQKTEDQIMVIRKELEEELQKEEAKTNRKVPADKVTEEYEEARNDLNNAKARIKALVSCRLTVRTGNYCQLY